ncbi:MAG: hypothetical protein FJ146_09400 [Deltaproteobacteria bacterium]|nr:hypothetical protein [Deltaproteobacteria bacterium]
MIKGLRKLVITLTIVGLTAFFANLIIDNPYTHRLIRVIINEQVTKHTNLTVNFQALKVSLLPAGLDIYGLKVAASDAADQPMVTVPQLRTRISIWSLILGELRLSNVELNDPTIIWPPPAALSSLIKPDPKIPQHQRVTDDDQLNWPPRFDLPVSRIALINAKLYVEQPLFSPPISPSYLTLAVGALDAIFDYRSWRKMSLDFDIKAVDLSVGPSSMLESTKLAGRLALNDRLLSLTDLLIHGERVNFTGEGNGELKTTEGRNPLVTGVQFYLDHRGSADMSLLGSYLELPDTHGRIDGDFRLDLDIPFTGQASPQFKVTGKGKSVDARLYGFRLLDSHTSFAIDENAVSLPDIEIIVDKTRVARGGGAIKLNRDLDLDFTLDADKLHLVDLLESLDVDSRLVDLAITGKNIRIKGKGDPFTLTTTAKVNASDIVVPSIPLPLTKFPRSPSCQVDLLLLVTSSQLDLTGTKATCIDENTKTDLATGKHIAPAKTNIQIAGGLQFAGPGKTDIHIGTRDADLRLAEYFIQQPISGTGSIDAKLSGPFDQIVLDARLDQSDVAVSHIPFGVVTGSIKYVDNILSWRDIEAYPVEGGSIELPNGQLDISTSEMPIKTSIEIADLSRDVVRAIANAIDPDNDFSAEIRNLSGTYQGPLLQMLAGEAKLNLTAKDARLNGETLVTMLDTNVVADKRGWRTQNLVVNINSLSLTGKVAHQRSTPFNLAYAESAKHPLYVLGLHPSDKLSISARTLSQKGPLPSSGRTSDSERDHLSNFPYVGEYLRPRGMKGLIVGQADYSGTLESMQGSFTAAIERPAIFGMQMTAINLRGFSTGSRFDLVVNQAGNALDGRLSFDLSQNGVPFEWYISCHRYDLRVLGSSLLRDDPRNYLYFTGDWHLKGIFNDFWHSVGDLTINDLRANFVNDIASQTRTIQVRQDQPVKLLFTKKGWRFDNNRDLFLSGKYMQARITTKDSRPPERLGLFFESVVDAGIIKEFVQDVDTAEGKVNIIGSIFGSVTEPRPIVEFSDLAANDLTAATWRPLSVGIAEIRPAFRNIKLKAAYKDGRVIIDKLAAEKGTGSVSASGSINLGGVSNTESHLDINLSDATVVYPVAFIKNFESQISGNLVVSGQGMPFKLAGDIVINRARSTREVDIRNEIVNALRQKSIGSSSLDEKPILTLDLNVGANQSINIHNRNLQVQMSTDLRIKGTDKNPVLSGQLEVDKGKFTYKQDFKITRGLVIFDDPIKADPSLDILAVSDVDIYRVYLGISGRASNPTVEFSVDPPTRENGNAISKLEILVLLSRGKLPQESQSMGQQTQSAATSEAANILLGQFEEPVEKLLDASGQSVVRNVYIDTHPSTDGSPVPRLNLPFDLGENLDVVLRTDQATSQVSLEYNVNENIYVSGIHEVLRNKDALPTQNTPGNIEGDSRVNLKFRFSFE